MAPATRPNQISDWKKQFMDSASTLFEAAHKPVVASAEPDIALLYEQIGRLQPGGRSHGADFL